MSDSRPKTRHLTTFEFFEIVQLEYMCANLRARIYSRSKDKAYWNRVADGKRQVIEQIAARNSLPSIFTDSDLETVISNKLYREETFPNFCYKDPTQKMEQEYYDLLNYYSKGSDIRFQDNGETIVGKVLRYTPFDKTVLIQSPSSSVGVEVLVTKVARIL